MNLYTDTYHLTLISIPKISIDILWDISLFFLILSLIYAAAIFVYKYRISAISAKALQRKRELAPMVNEFIFYHEGASKEEKCNYLNFKIEIRELIKDNFTRKILSEIMLDLQKDLSGDSQKNLFKLYRDLNLHLDALAKLKSKRWEVVSKAIKDLTQMQVTEAYSLTANFINNKSSTIRKQAEIATVSLKPEGLNYFLDTTKHKISEWQQLKLLDVIRNQVDYNPPRFKLWLTSSNSYVVLFALRLIKFYNQNDAKASLIELIKHKNNQIKQEAICCINEFYMVEALETLKLVFWQSTTPIKITILDTIGNIGSEEDIPFLELLQRKESNFYVKNKAQQSINILSPERILPSKGIQDISSYEIPKDLELDKTEENKPELRNKEKSLQNEIDQRQQQLKNSTTILFNEQQNSKSILEDTPYTVAPLNSAIDNYAISFKEIKELTLVYEEVTSDLAQKIEPLIANESFESASTDQIFNFYQDELNFIPITTEPIQHKTSPMANQKSDFFKTFLQVFNLNSEKYSSSYIDQELTAIDESVKSEKVSTFDEMSLKIQEWLLRIVGAFTKIKNKTNTSETSADVEDEILTISFDVLAESSECSSTAEEKSKTKQKLADKHDNNEISKDLEGFETNMPLLGLNDDLIADTSLDDEDSEEDIVQMLENLRDMGDYREIPLLTEMLDDTKYSAYKEHIKQLIERFSEDAEYLDLIKKETTKKRTFNVLDDLFRNCDADKKMILLDEVVAIGDADDIRFLEKLLVDTNEEVQLKAAEVIKKLRLKLKQEVQLELDAILNKPNAAQSNDGIKNKEHDLEVETPKEYSKLLEVLEINESSDTSDIFDISFQFSSVNTSKNKSSLTQNETAQNSFANCLLEMSNRLKKLLNG